MKRKYLHLLGHSAALHSDVTSRVTNADDHHPLPVHVFGPLVVPAVEVRSLECLNSFSTEGVNFGDHALHFRVHVYLFCFFCCFFFTWEIFERHVRVAVVA